MSPAQEIKRLIFKTILKKAKWETAKILAKSPRNSNKEFEHISIIKMVVMFLPKVYEQVSKEWKKVTGASMPVTFKEVLKATYYKLWNYDLDFS